MNLSAITCDLKCLIPREVDREDVAIPLAGW